MRVGVVDIGSDSTRLLVADVTGANSLRPLVRRSTPTQLSAGLYASGRLTPAAQARVMHALVGYSEEMERQSCHLRGAALTSAVRDAQNGPEFTAQVRERFRIDARVIDGYTEAQLAFRGATLGRSFDGRVLVVDVGGGSTEVVVGEGGRALYPGTTRAGAVRKSARFLHGDPPCENEVATLRENVRRAIAIALPASMRDGVVHGLVSAESWTWRPALAALGERGVVAARSGIVDRALVELAVERLLTVRKQQLRRAPGIHPARASTLLAGTALVLEVIDAFRLDAIEIAETDLLEGLALHIASERTLVA